MLHKFQQGKITIQKLLGLTCLNKIFDNIKLIFDHGYGHVHVTHNFDRFII